ncbi:hypothetical protein P5V15_011668 [Pogonomyrmex californicus]
MLFFVIILQKRCRILRAKGKESTEEEQKMIINLHNQCKSLEEIAKLVDKPRSTMQSIIDRFYILTESDKRFIIRQIKLDPKISLQKLRSNSKIVMYTFPLIQFEMPRKWISWPCCQGKSYG